MASASCGKRTIEDMYQSKDSQRNRILHDPEAYIGSTKKQTETLWIHDGEGMVRRKVSYVPALVKIFEEILLNVSDQRQRDMSMDIVTVKINVRKNRISVRNKGAGIPVVEHPKEGVYVPEMLFGQLLTSSNFGDNVTSTIVGRNGYGAKLTNLFSSEFIIKIWDGTNNKYYKQKFGKNMGSRSEPIIRLWNKNTSFTKISFTPDMERFGIDELDDDIVALLRTRLYSFAASLGEHVQVKLNCKHISINSFRKYVFMYPIDHSRMVMEIIDGLEIYVTASHGLFEQISFVNSVATINGGTHVDHVTNGITKYIVGYMRKERNIDMTTGCVKNHLWVFVNALIDNPQFESQKKESLTLQRISFESKFELQEAFLKKVVENSGVIEKLLSCETLAQSKEAEGEVEKNDGAKTKRIQIDKLHDAEALDEEEPRDCTLILTEGDSAKSVVMAIHKCLKREYRDKYGVYALEGKVLNVWRAQARKIKENKVLQNLKTIIGLEDGKIYNETDSLRYKSVLIMTDQDHDGFHIQGLLINLFHYFWPELLKIHPPFLSGFRKPEPWLAIESSREYFSDPLYKTDFVWDEEQQDGEALKKKGSQKSIESAFGKQNIKDRRELFQSFIQPKSDLHQTEAGAITITEFMENNLLSFSIADLRRSIPSMIDGLKPVQRKVLYCLRKRSSNEEIKVPDVSALVSEYSNYEHSEKCLHATIIKMAQDFVGTNNLPLLQALGHFGTRHLGGKDAGTPRYLKTKLSPATKVLFPEVDDPFLSYKEKNMEDIEPEWYIPIIPTVLVNGCQGIGTGWSTYVPNYKTTDIICNLEHLLNNEELDPMVPWYQGFKGTIEEEQFKVEDESQVGTKYITTGKLEVVDQETRIIRELPIKIWTGEYKHSLDKMPALIKECKDIGNSNQNVGIRVKLCKSKTPMTQKEHFDEKKELRLVRKIATTNMHLFDQNGQIKRYVSAEQIIREFYRVRIECYESRKRHMDNQLAAEFSKLSDQVKFVSDVLSGEFTMKNWTDAGLLEELKKRFVLPNNCEYDFILDLRTRIYTQEELQELKEQREKVQEQMVESDKISSLDIYAQELKILKEIARKIEEATEASNNPVVETSSSAGASKAASQKRRARDESEQDEGRVAPDNTKLMKHG